MTSSWVGYQKRAFTLVELLVVIAVIALWLVPSTGFVLQQNPDLGIANWVAAPDTPALDCTNLHYRVTLTPSLTRAYYRLRQQ